MKLFLTSSPSGALDVPNYDKVLDESNGFVDLLKKYWKNHMRGLIISAFPYDYECNDEMKDFFYQAFDHSGVKLESLDLWDYRVNVSKELLHSYDMIMLAGGHVPTQNQYFCDIHLKDMIKDYKGIVIGVSAGTMNAASIVYAVPENEGESIDPSYQRFIEGLDLTSFQVLPHYQMVKDYYLDNQRLFEDIVYQDSYHRSFIALEDGSFIFAHNGISTIYGRAYKIEDGQIIKIVDYNESLQID